MGPCGMHVCYRAFTRGFPTGKKHDTTAVWGNTGLNELGLANPNSQM